MEHRETNIDALRSDRQEEDSRMFPFVPHSWNYIHQEELLYGT